MSSENNSQGPLQSFENGATRIKIWEQNTGDKRFVTASVGKIYKDKDGEWRESRSFTTADLHKLQEILPTANHEMAKWQDYYREADRQNAPESERRDLTAERDAVMQAAHEPNDGNTQTHARVPDRES